MTSPVVTPAVLKQAPDTVLLFNHFLAEVDRYILKHRNRPDLRQLIEPVVDHYYRGRRYLWPNGDHPNLTKPIFARWLARSRSEPMESYVAWLNTRVALPSVNPLGVAIPTEGENVPTPTNDPPRGGRGPEPSDEGEPPSWAERFPETRWNPGSSWVPPFEDICDSCKAHNIHLKCLYATANAGACVICRARKVKCRVRGAKRIILTTPAGPEPMDETILGPSLALTGTYNHTPPTQERLRPRAPTVAEILNTQRQITTRVDHLNASMDRLLRPLRDMELEGFREDSLESEDFNAQWTRSLDALRAAPSSERPAPSFVTSVDLWLKMSAEAINVFARISDLLQESADAAVEGGDALIAYAKSLG